MDSNGFKRKLTAILSADVQGYSRLMGDDEEATIKTLISYRKAISKLVHQYRGRVVDSPGDNLLAEFTSVVDAVNCAVEIQRELAEQNNELPYERQMEFRIGVNVGDVVQEKERIYGDGVNIAARVESLCQAGGICISGRAYDQVANKLGLDYENLGEHTVKNIKTPIRVYRVLSYPGAAAHRVTQAKRNLTKKILWASLSIISLTMVILGGLYLKYFFMPSPKSIDPHNKTASFESTGPSIAVLPFDNMTGDPEKEFICNGITENIIAVLSQSPKVTVIARNSTFAYKGKPKNITQIGDELGAQYVIEGSIQSIEHQIRITVQAIESISGHHVWTERYDRDFKDFFKLQDEIALEILKSFAANITEGEQSYSRWRDLKDLNLALKIFRAFDYYYSMDPNSNQLAKKEIEEAIAIDQNLAISHVLLAGIYVMDLQNNNCESDMVCFANATKAARTALSLDYKNSDAHQIAGLVFLYKRDFENAITSFTNAISLNPNNSDAYALLGATYSFSNEPSKGLIYLEKAYRLNPIPPPYFYSFLGVSLNYNEQHSEAMAICEKGVKKHPDVMILYPPLCSAYYHSGLMEKARGTAEKILSIEPNFSTINFCKRTPYKTKVQEESCMDILLKSGWPE